MFFWANLGYYNIKTSGGDGNFVISSSCVGFTNSLGCCSAMCENGSAIANSLDLAFNQIQDLFKK